MTEKTSSRFRAARYFDAPGRLHSRVTKLLRDSGDSGEYPSARNGDSNRQMRRRNRLAGSPPYDRDGSSASLFESGHTQGQNFVGRESVAREDASTVTAEHDGSSFLRKTLCPSCSRYPSRTMAISFAMSRSAFWVHRRVGTHSPWPRGAIYAYRRWCSKLYRFEWAGAKRNSSDTGEGDYRRGRANKL